MLVCVDEKLFCMAWSLATETFHGSVFVSEVTVPDVTIHVNRRVESVTEA